MHRSGLGTAETMKQLDDGIGNTLVSLCGNSALARANSALRIDKYPRWLTQLVLIADAILQGRPAGVEGKRPGVFRVHTRTASKR